MLIKTSILIGKCLPGSLVCSFSNKHTGVFAPLQKKDWLTSDTEHEWLELPRPDKTARLTLKLIYFPVTVTAVKLRGKAGVCLVTQSLS